MPLGAFNAASTPPSRATPHSCWPCAAPGKGQAMALPRGRVPWHAAMAATYAHATAPLRRLADRYVVRAALAVANGQPVPAEVSEAFQRLPAMARAGARDSQIERAAIDLAEAAILAGREGEDFRAVITDLGEQGARIQLCDLPIVARTTAHGVMPGAEIGVRLDSADPARRLITFSRVS